MDIRAGYSKNEIAMHIYTYNQEIGGSLACSTELFKEATARLLLSAYLDIVEQVVKNKNIKIDDISVPEAILKGGKL